MSGIGYVTTALGEVINMDELKAKKVRVKDPTSTREKTLKDHLRAPNSPVLSSPLASTEGLSPINVNDRNEHQEEQNIETSIVVKPKKSRKKTPKSKTTSKQTEKTVDDILDKLDD